MLSLHRFSLNYCHQSYLKSKQVSHEPLTNSGFLPQVIASVLMLTREISDNKTLTIKSSYHTEYQQSRKWKKPV